MYNTANGRTVDQEVHTAVLLLLRTAGTRGLATTHTNSSVSVSSQQFVYANTVV